MNRLNVPKEGSTVTFGQLYGMHDHITLTLGEQETANSSYVYGVYYCCHTFTYAPPHAGRAGYEAYKYLPYGPVVEVLPYLCRRANENSSMFKGAIEYRKFIGQELMRRLGKATKLF